VRVAAPLAVLLSIAIAAVVAAQDWRHIHLRSAIGLLTPTVFGSPLGLLVLTNVHQDLLKSGQGPMAKLTEQEQQEVIRFIEAGKPLPDKYRFLLFDDKREVELVWNGKTNEVTCQSRV
jgi:hypothetical protein